jgi:hypothetical protein
MMRTLPRLLLAIVALLCTAASAHELSMAEMDLREVSRGEFLWQWTAGEKRAPAEELTPVWPEGCRAEQNLLRCGAAGLQGTLAIEGVGKRYSVALVKVFWLDGPSRVYTVTAVPPRTAAAAVRSPRLTRCSASSTSSAPSTTCCSSSGCCSSSASTAACC